MLGLNTGKVGFGIIGTGTAFFLLYQLMTLALSDNAITKSAAVVGIAIAAFIAIWVGFVISIFAIKHANGTKWGERGLMLFLFWLVAYLGVVFFHYVWNAV